MLPAAPPAAPRRTERLPVVQRPGVDALPAAATVPAGALGAACFVANCAVAPPHAVAATATSPSDTSRGDIMATSPISAIRRPSRQSGCHHSIGSSAATRAVALLAADVCAAVDDDGVGWAGCGSLSGWPNRRTTT